MRQAQSPESMKKMIVQLRHEKNLTQFQLASMSGVSLSAVIGAETGRQLPRVDNAIKIAEALGVRVDDIAWGSRE